MKFNWLLLIPVLVAVAFLGASLGQLQKNRAVSESGGSANTLPSTRIGQPAPALKVSELGNLPLLTQETLSAGDGPRLVNVWASWCAPCRVEHPHLVTLAEEGVAVHGINFKDDPAKALKFLDDLGNPYTTIGADTEGRTGLEWGVFGVPETYVLDGDGKIVLRFAGPITARVLEETIRPALAEAGAATN